MLKYQTLSLKPPPPKSMSQFALSHNIRLSVKCFCSLIEKFFGKAIETFTSRKLLIATHSPLSSIVFTLKVKKSLLDKSTPSSNPSLTQSSIKLSMSALRFLIRPKTFLGLVAFSKTISSSLRVGYMVLPQKLVPIAPPLLAKH